MWCVEVEIRGMRSNNTGEHNLSQIEAIQSLMRSWEQSAKFFSFLMGVVGEV